MKKASPKKSKPQQKRIPQRDHYNAILIEDLTSQFKMVTEAVRENRVVLETKIDSVRTELLEKIEDNQTGIRLLDAKIDGVEKRLDAKIDGLEKKLTDKIDGVEKRLDAKIDGVEKKLTDKIDGVEQGLRSEMRQMKGEILERLDKVDKGLDQHEEDIAHLKEVCARNAS